MMDKVEKGVISNIYLVEPCHSMPQGCHKDGAPLDEVEKGAISNVYLRELGHSWTQEWRPAGWGWGRSDQQCSPAWPGPLAATRMVPRWMRLRKEWSTMFRCVSWPTCHWNSAPLDEVEKGRNSNFYLGELGHSPPQGWRPAEWGWERSSWWWQNLFRTAVHGHQMSMSVVINLEHSWAQLT